MVAQNDVPVKSPKTPLPNLCSKAESKGTNTPKLKHPKEKTAKHSNPQSMSSKLHHPKEKYPKMHIPKTDQGQPRRQADSITRPSPERKSPNIKIPKANQDAKQTPSPERKTAKHAILRANLKEPPSIASHRSSADPRKLQILPSRGSYTTVKETVPSMPEAVTQFPSTKKRRPITAIETDLAGVQRSPTPFPPAKSSDSEY